MTLQIGDTFPDIAAAKLAIKDYIAINSESSKTVYSDKLRVLLVCKSKECTFRIRALDSKKRGVLITQLQPHICSPATHYNTPYTNTLLFLISHHRAAVIDNPKITAKQLQSNERLQYSNSIPYLQAYRLVCNNFILVLILII
jgi:hypothetical protein